MNPRVAIACLLALGAACGPPPRFATHTCGDGPRVVHMPLTCVEANDTLADETDQLAGIEAALVRLARRTNGRPGETMAGLVQEYRRLDRAFRQRYAAACQGWTIPCDPSQSLAYQETVTAIRARNGQLRSLRAAIDDLAGKTQWIEPGDEAAKALLLELESAAAALDQP
jgi:hypothetical protein